MTLPIYNSSLLNAILHILQLLAQFECIKTAFLSHSFVSHLAHSLHLLFSSLQLTLVGSIARLLPSGLSTYPSSPGPLHFLENFVLHQALGHLFYLKKKEGKEIITVCFVHRIPRLVHCFFESMFFTSSL